MPVRGISEDVRITAMVRFALGIADPAKRGAPSERPWFVPVAPDDDPQDPLYRDVIALYGETPRRLRGMLLFDEDVVGPVNGQELSWAVYNRAFGGARQLRCIGTGGSVEHGVDEHGAHFDRRGEAVTRDPRWAQRIAQATGEPATEVGPGRWRVRCHGRDCPKFYKLSEAPVAPGTKAPMADGHDPDAACKLTGVFSFLLLNPETDRPICTARLTTGSINSIRDITSGLRTIRGFNREHRTAGIPFWLVRRQAIIPHAGKRTKHSVIRLHADLSEVNRIGMVPVEQVFLGIEEREQYLRLLSETPISYRDVRDVLPETHDPRLLTAARATEPEPETSPLAAPAGRQDRDELVLDHRAEESPLLRQVDVDAAAEEPEAPLAPGALPDDDDPAPRDVIDGLKARWGIPTKWPADPVERDRVAAHAAEFKALVNRARVETGDEASGTPIGDMRMKHARWLQRHLDAGDRRTATAEVGDVAPASPSPSSAVGDQESPAAEVDQGSGEGTEGRPPGPAGPSQGSLL